MKVRIENSNLSGSIEAISSKSQAHRLLICAAFAEKPTKIKCSTLSDDINATVHVLNSLGADISCDNSVFTVIPIKEVPKSAEIDVGESGSTLRFILPIVCALGTKSKIKMHGKLSERPLSPLWEELVRHGAVLSKTDDVILTDGKICGGEFNIQGNVSSQFISGLMFALPLIEENSKINIIGKCESANYIKMTESAILDFGIEYEFIDGTYSIKGNNKYTSPEVLTVEGDWSNSAFWLCLGALKGPVTVTGLNMNSLQGDKSICDVLQKLGANVIYGKASVTVSDGPLKGTTIDCSDIPDLVPALSAVAAVCEGETVFYNASRLRIKESNRITAIINAVNNLGGEAVETDDGLKILGKPELLGGTVNSYNDHRIAMMSAILSPKCKNCVIIEDASAVNKSYPMFYSDFMALGGKVEVII